jgi:LemA protein
MNNVFGKMVATIENYPNLKSTDAIRDLMQSADYCEREIAANRRLYNSVVNEFNQKIYIFPSAYVASRRGYTNLPLIKGSDEQLEDVKLEIK